MKIATPAYCISKTIGRPPPLFLFCSFLQIRTEEKGMIIKNKHSVIALNAYSVRPILNDSENRFRLSKRTKLLKGVWLFNREWLYSAGDYRKRKYESAVLSESAFS